MTESKQRQVSILLVEDEALIRMMIAGMVEELGHSVAGEAANIADALRLARTANFEIAILDQIGADLRHGAGHQLDIIDIHIPCGAVHAD